MNLYSFSKCNVRRGQVDSYIIYECWKYLSREKIHDHFLFSMTSEFQI